MKKIILFFIPFLFLTQIFSQEHPRLFFDKKDLVTLRARQHTAIGKEMIECMQKQLLDLKTGNVDGVLYDNALSAAMNGFLYLITEDESYAAESKVNIENVFALGQWADKNLKGLNSYWMGTYIAFAYDFCYNASNWDAEYKKNISTKILEMANMIADHGGTEQNTNPASNWQGIRGASAALCFYACDETYDEERLTKSVKKVNDYVKENYGGKYMSRGWNIEGSGYMFYPTGNFIGPYGIALERLDPAKGLRHNPSFVNSFWTIYANISTALDLKGFGGFRPDFGDDNPHISGEGAFGQAFFYLPEDMKKAAKHCYDMAVGGVRNTKKHDGYRFGTVWAYMFYPDQLESQDPMTVKPWKELFLEHTTDGCGYFTYRNAYKDGNDHIAQMYLKFRGNKGHNGPDALTYRIIGQGAPWAIGGGRYGPKAEGLKDDVYWHLMNTVYATEPLVVGLVNPETNKSGTSGKSGWVVGNPLLREDGSGHIVSEIDVNNVWTKEQKRWFVADFDKGRTGAEAVYLVADVTLDGKYWQMVTTDDNEIQFYSDYFMITAPNGATMKGTVLLSEGDLNFKQRRSVRGSEYGDSNYSKVVNFQSSNGKFLVALTVAAAGKNHPVVTLTGNDIVGASIKVGAKQYTLTDDNVLYDGVNQSTSPRPVWSLDNNVGDAPLTVQFNAANSVSFDGNSLSFAYDFGNGDTSNEMSPKYTYKVPGVYLAKLDVKNSKGQTRSLYSYVFVKNNPGVTVNIVKPVQDVCAVQDVVSLEAEASTSLSGASIEKVEFLVEGSVIGTSNEYPYSFDWQPTAEGIYKITARAYAAGGEAISESPVFYLSVQEKVTTDVEKTMTAKDGVEIYNRPETLVLVNGSDEDVRFDVLNVFGKTVCSSILPASGEYHIDKSELLPGLYFVCTGELNYKVLI